MQVCLVRPLACACASAVLLAGCATPSIVTQTPAPLFGVTYPRQLSLAEPGPTEVIVVINDNARTVHAGMWVGSQLIDPAGSYFSGHHARSDWHGASLADYVRFQLSDGPQVKLYRFKLPAEAFAQLQSRANRAGGTMPLFCASAVQNLLSGIVPFQSLSNTWLITPHALGERLDAILLQSDTSGACLWPNGASCRPMLLTKPAERKQ